MSLCGLRDAYANDVVWHLRDILGCDPSFVSAGAVLIGEDTIHSPSGTKRSEILSVLFM
jgi:hypothetical protein